MRGLGYLLSNYLIFMILALLLTAFQTGLWLQVMGHFPPPHIPTTILAFWSIYRNFRESLIFVYLLTLATVPFTALPLGILLIIHLILFLSVFLFRQRIFWPGPTYFMIVSAAMTLLFPLVHLLISWTVESNHIHQFEFFEWTMRPLLSALVALPLFYLFRWVDSLTQKVLPQEVVGTELL